MLTESGNELVKAHWELTPRSAEICCIKVCKLGAVLPGVERGPWLIMDPCSKFVESTLFVESIGNDVGSCAAWGIAGFSISQEGNGRSIVGEGKFMVGEGVPEQRLRSSSSCEVPHLSRSSSVHK